MRPQVVWHALGDITAMKLVLVISLAMRTSTATRATSVMKDQTSLILLQLLMAPSQRADCVREATTVLGVLPP
jgi:hypothetical protein